MFQQISTKNDRRCVNYTGFKIGFTQDLQQLCRVQNPSVFWVITMRSLRNNPEDGRIQFNRSESLRSRMS